MSRLSASNTRRTMNEFIRQAVDNCRSVYNLIHGPEVWLVIGKVAALIGLFDGGVLTGLWLAALLGANNEDKNDEHKNDL